MSSLICDGSAEEYTETYKLLDFFFSGRHPSTRSTLSWGMPLNPTSKRPSPNAYLDFMWRDISFRGRLKSSR